LLLFIYDYLSMISLYLAVGGSGRGDSGGSGGGGGGGGGGGSNGGRGGDHGRAGRGHACRDGPVNLSLTCHL